MSVTSGQSITKRFTTRAFATGVATDATGTPTGILYVNGTADAAVVTVTNTATGKYKAAVTLPTLITGDLVEIEITATVSGVTDSQTIWCDAKDVPLVDGVEMQSALQYIAASTAGKVIGAGTGTEVFTGLDGLTTRLIITVDANGNRSAIVYG